MKQPSFLARKTLGQPNYFLIAMAMAFVLAFIPRGARRAIDGNTNKAEDWLPASYDEAIDLRWFRDHFLGEQFALISWEGCTLGNKEKLEHLARLLVPSDDSRAAAAGSPELAEEVEKRATWYKRVMTGPEVVEQLTSDPVGLSRSEALRRLEGALVGPVQRNAQGESLGNDSRPTCLIVYLSSEATKTNGEMRQAIETIEDLAVSECGIPRETIHMGGPPVDNITIDVEGEKTLFRLASLSGIVGVVLSYWCFRSIKLTAIIFAVGVISAGMSLAIVFYFGIFEVLITGRETARLGTVDAILMSMPAVVYVLGLSGAIHTVNYYRDARREHGLEGAAETAVRLGWGPCTLAAFTTAVGLGSLYTSDILPIKKFGMFTAIAVLATVGILFTILPVFLHRFPVNGKLFDRKDRSGAQLPSWATHVFSFVIRRHAVTFAFWLCVMAVVGYGMTKITTSVQLLKLLDEDTDLIHDYAWLEENLGNLVPMEVILTIPPERLRTADQLAEEDGEQYRLTMMERLELIRAIQQRIETLPEISRVMSVATFTPESTESGISVTADRSADYAKNLELEKSRNLLLDLDYLRMERAAGEPEDLTGRELWRLSARVAALSDDEEGVDYGQFVHELQAAVDPVLLAYQQRDAVIRELHAAGKQLNQSNLVILYRGDGDPLSSESQEILLGQLLVQGGAKRAPTGTTPYVFDLANLDDPPDGIDAESYLDRVVEKLGERDAVVVVSAGDDPLVDRLQEHGLDVIDVPTQWSDGAPGEVASASSALAAGEEPRPIRAVYTGMVPLVYKTQRQLLLSLRESIAWATVLIAVVMVFVLRSPLAGLISMIPNVFPIVIVFGTLGWLGIKVDIGIMMTASVALGVAVDDTVHFLTWFRRGVATGLGRKDAARLAYERCATAMMQTTLIGGLGIAVFATSTFTPTQQFGYLMITMLGAALVGDLLLLPAILSGPLGKFFGGNLVSTRAARFAGSLSSDWDTSGEDDGGEGADEPERLDAAQEPAPTSESAPRDPINLAAEQVAHAPSNDVLDRGEQERLDAAEGPHAALHAKLRSLRRQSAEDSHTPQDR